jgi:hypothetical protein
LPLVGRSNKGLFAAAHGFMRCTPRFFVEEGGFGAIEDSNTEDAIVILVKPRDVPVVFMEVQMPGMMAYSC